MADIRLMFKNAFTFNHVSVVYCFLIQLVYEALYTNGLIELT